MTSHDDGLTWAILSNRYDDLGEEVSWQNQGDFSKVSYYYDEINKGVFVAVGGGKHSFNYDRAAIYYSYDYGDTWTKATVEPNPGKGFGLALGQNSSGNPIFISTGLDGDTPTSSAKFIISTDLGKNWTWVDGGERSPFGEIGYVNGHFIMAGVAPTMDLGGGGGIIIDFGLGDGPIGDGDSLGDEEDGYPFEVYTSADGVNWWKKFRVTLPEIINASSIAYGDGAYLIAGEDIDYNQMIFYSADGEEWEHYSPNLDSDGLVEILGSVYFKGNFFLFGYNSLSYFDEEDSNPIIFSPKFSLGNGVNRKSPSSTFGVRFCSAGVTSFCRPQGAVPQNNLLANVYTELLGLYQQLLTALQEQNS